MPTTLLKNPVAMTGTAAGATTTSGAQPPNTLTVNGTPGQATTGTGQTAGAGANVSFTAGEGGTAPSGSANGAGGSVTINPGAPGPGGGTAAAYGNVLMATAGGKVGIGTHAPEQMLHVAGAALANALLFPVAATGIEAYNTADHVTNFEKGYIKITGAGSTFFFELGSAAGGTGARRVVNFIQPDGTFNFGTTSGVKGIFELNVAASATVNGALGRLRTAVNYTGSGTLGAGFQFESIYAPNAGTGNIFAGVQAAPTINSTGAASAGTYSAFRVSARLASTSGYTTVRLMDVGTNTSSAGAGTHTSLFSVDSVGNAAIAGNLGVGTPTPGSKLHVNGGVQVGTPTGGDKGSGSINVSGDIYKNGSAYANPDYVFERHFTGATQAPYPGPVPLEQLEEAIKTEGQLPGIGREPLGLFGRQDVLLEKLEEAYLYIIELTRRVNRLEAALAPAAGNEVE